MGPVPYRRFLILLSVMLSSWYCSCFRPQLGRNAPRVALEGHSKARKCEESSPRVALEEYYEARRSKEKAPLFQNWKAYYDHLPIREVACETLPYLKICDCPFWVNDEDLEAMAQRLEKGEDVYGARFSVAYIAGRPGSGKTASVLAAFVNSVKSGRRYRFTHYLYFAFANNGAQYFKATDTNVISRSCENTAMDQGADFMLTCVRRMLLLKHASAFNMTATSEVGGTDSEMDVLKIFKTININPSPRDMREAQRDLEMLLDRCFDGEPDWPRLLVHVDEYEKMTGHSGTDCNAANFRRGAMELLACDPRIQCVTTYTEPLFDFPAAPSSGVCRLPCPIPVFDIWKFEEDEKVLGLDSFKWGDGDRAAQRTWATLLFRLSAKFRTGELLPNYHIGKTTGEGLDNHVASIFGRESAENDYDMQKVLSMEVLAVPEWDAPRASLTYSEALGLMNGIGERYYEMEYRAKLHIGLALVRKRIVGDWVELLRSERALNDSDIGYDGYMDARSDFHTCLLSADVPDVFPGPPLEAAFAWALYALPAETHFDWTFAFKFRPVSYKKARLFRESQSHTGCMVHPSSLHKNTLYRARELEKKETSEIILTKLLLPLNSEDEELISSKKRVPLNFQAAHPLCDIFFVTDDNCLVMIDVTASDGEIVDEKAEKLGAWVKKYFGLEPNEWRDKAFRDRLNQDPAERRGSLDGSQRVFQLGFDDSERPYSCRGIVLAPFCPNRSNTVNGVMCVRGKDARRLLGALGQIFRWFAPSSKAGMRVVGDT